MTPLDPRAPFATDPVGQQADQTADLRRRVAALERCRYNPSVWDRPGWHDVGAAGEPAFLGAWTNHPAYDAQVGFFKDSTGFVHPRGVAHGGLAAQDDVFLLPAGFRPPPPAFPVFPTSVGPAAGGLHAALILINPNTGHVSYVGGPGGTVDALLLDGLHFYAGSA